MIKTNNESTMGQKAYVAPTCKMVVLTSVKSLLADSYGENGISSLGDVEDGSENDHSGNWVY